jgi:hypothetical protein
VTARADFPAGGSTGLHTHPGDEISFVAEGAVEIVMDGSSKVYRKGEAFKRDRRQAARRQGGRGTSHGHRQLRDRERASRRRRR